jgi:hypothetical protein
MKRDFSRQGHRERIDKVEKKAAHSGAVKKEKSTKRRLSIYDDFEDDEDMEDFDPSSFRESRLG